MIHYRFENNNKSDGRSGGGQVVSIHVFNFDNPSSNPADIQLFFLVKFCDKHTLMKMRPGLARKRNYEAASMSSVTRLGDI